MTRRRPKIGGRREGAGRKPAEGVAASVTKRLRLTPERAREQEDAAQHAGKTWSSWILSLVDRELRDSSAGQSEDT